jgi:hypothetical protein
LRVSGDLKKLFEEFRGRPSRRDYVAVAHPDAPRHLVELGGLLKLKLVGRRVLRFDDREATLAADVGGNLWIARRVARRADGSVDVESLRAMLPGDGATRRQYQGEIASATYSADKRHIEPDSEIVHYTHSFENTLPKLYQDGPHLIIEGGRSGYFLSWRGIEG